MFALCPVWSLTSPAQRFTPCLVNVMLKGLFACQVFGYDTHIDTVDDQGGDS